jgi:hypothetical protein
MHVHSHIAVDIHLRRRHIHVHLMPVVVGRAEGRPNPHLHAHRRLGHLHAHRWLGHLHLHSRPRYVHAHGGRVHIHVHVDARRRRDVDLHRRHVHLHVHAHPAHRHPQSSQRHSEDLHRHDGGRPVDRRLEVVVDGDEGEDEDGLLDDGKVGAAGAGRGEVGLHKQVVDGVQSRAAGSGLDVRLVSPDLTVEDLHGLIALSLLANPQPLEALLKQNLIEGLLVAVRSSVGDLIDQSHIHRSNL